MKKYTLMVRGKIFQHMIQFNNKKRAERVMNWNVWEYAKIINNETLETEVVKAKEESR